MTFVQPTPNIKMQEASNGSVPSREQTMEERKERMRQQLIRRKIPEDLWDYYLKSPEHWDFGDTTEDGLQKGIRAILMSPYSRSLLGRKRIHEQICESKDETDSSDTSSGRNKKVYR